MTQATSSSTSGPAATLIPESFMAVVYRRLRYAIAILVSAVFFVTVGWKIAAPPADWAGVSLVAWHHHGIFAPLMLSVMLLIAMAVCSLIVHPESPHMGLACALLGMAGLSIRGGPVYMLIRHGQEPGESFQQISRGLALECFEWALILLIAETFARLLHERFFANIHWIMRSAPDIDEPLLMKKTHEDPAVMGVALSFSQSVGTHKLARAIAAPLATVASGIMAFIMLYALMQSQSKGQVLMACFAAFFVSTMFTYIAFPRVPMIAFLLAVPVTAATAYLYGQSAGTSYPGHAAFFAMRALPIDYFAAGVPGAIFGYYAGFRWALHSTEE